MPTVDDFADYPKGTVSQGPGDCIDVFDWTFDGEDGEKIVATLRQNPAGSTFGTRSGTLAFSSAISHAGFERDWMGKWQKREVLELRLKLPGITITVTGRLTKPSISGSVDDFVKFKISCLGKPSFSLV
jgi:hypothetical protein